MASGIKCSHRAAVTSMFRSTFLPTLAVSLAVLIVMIISWPARSQGTKTTTQTETYANGATKYQDTTVTSADGTTKYSETHTEYDENGRPTHETQNTYENGAVKQTHDKTWIYDDKGRVIYFESSDSVRGDKIIPGVEEKYRVHKKYKDDNDKEGTITSEQVYSSVAGKWRDFDGEGGDTQPSMKPLQPLKSEKKSAEKAPEKNPEKAPKSKNDISGPTKDTAANTAGPESSYRLISPELVGQGETFTARVVEQTPQGEKPLQEGDVVSFQGQVVPVKSNGTVEVPAFVRELGNVFLTAEVVRSAVNGGEPQRVAITPEHVEVLPPSSSTAPVPTQISECPKILAGGQPIRVQGQSLQALQGAWLETRDGAKVNLTDSVGSSLERIYFQPQGTSLPKGDLRFVASDAAGKRYEAPNLSRVPAYHIEGPEIRTVGQVGTLTVTSDTDGQAIILGGEPVISLTERVVTLHAGQPAHVKFTANHVGVYTVGIRPLPKEEIPSGIKPPTVNTQSGPVQTSFNPTTNETTVNAPVHVTDAQGKPLGNTSVDMALQHPQGVSYGRVTTDSQGRATLSEKLPGRVNASDLSSHIFRVLGYAWSKVPSKAPSKPPVEQGGTPPTKPVDNPSTQENPPAKPGDQPSTQEKPPTTPTPNPTPNTVGLKQGCCCCVDDLELRLKTHARGFEKPTEMVWTRDENGEPIRAPRTKAPTFGHEFKVLIKYHVKRITDPDEEPGDCVLKWLEMSHDPPKTNLDAGAKVDDWNDIGKLMGAYDEAYIYGDGTTLGPWYRLWYDFKKKKPKHECPVPPNSGAPPPTVELDDKPSILYGTKDSPNHRILYFNIILESATHCLKPRKNDTDPKVPCTNKQLWGKQVLDVYEQGNYRNGKSKFYISDDGKTWIEAKLK